MKCDGCGVSIQPNERAAEAEYESNRFPAAAQRTSVCDDCYAAFMEWWTALPQSERNRIEAERREEEGDA